MLKPTRYAPRISNYSVSWRAPFWHVRRFPRWVPVYHISTKGDVFFDGISYRPNEIHTFSWWAKAFFYQMIWNWERNRQVANRRNLEKLWRDENPNAKYAEVPLCQHYGSPTDRKAAEAAAAIVRRARAAVREEKRAVTGPKTTLVY